MEKWKAPFQQTSKHQHIFKTHLTPEPKFTNSNPQWRCGPMFPFSFTLTLAGSEVGSFGVRDTKLKVHHVPFVWCAQTEGDQTVNHHNPLFRPTLWKTLPEKLLRWGWKYWTVSASYISIYSPFTLTVFHFSRQTTAILKLCFLSHTTTWLLKYNLVQGLFFFRTWSWNMWQSWLAIYRFRETGQRPRFTPTETSPASQLGSEGAGGQYWLLQKITL